MQKIGTVKFVQIQRDHMKIFEDGVRIYRPDPLLKVDKLQLTPDGIIGLHAGIKHIDVHNETHPNTRYRGDNKISFGFLQNYEQMRGRFDDHIKDGYAGENIIIESDVDISGLKTNQRFFLKHDDSLIELINVIPAPPCCEFSVYCLIVPQCQEDIKAGLQFLDHGKRGYYAELVPTDEGCFVQAGDELWVE